MRFRTHLLALVCGVGLASTADQAAAASYTMEALTSAPACDELPLGEAEFVCSCPDSSYGASIWGSGPYTGDSDICTAATHAGVLGSAHRAVVVYIEGGRDSYSGSTANGVTSSNWGSYGRSFYVSVPTVEAAAPAAQECSTIPSGVVQHDCSCAAGAPARSVWGSGPYTADSDLCTAARHAGVIGAQGGNVSVSLASGLDSYSGSAQNGVETRDWGAYGNSIVFAGAMGNTTTTTNSTKETVVLAAECGALPSGDAPYICSCPAGGVSRPVWGSGPYTADSDLCTAGRHSGAIGAQGGNITGTKSTGLGAYNGSNQNGVSTSNWGNYHTSIDVVGGVAPVASSLAACTTIPSGVDDHRCSCQGTETGAVWGSGPYTADSTLCAAALHEGVIDQTGGEVHVIRVPGLTSYRASESNGVMTGQWGDYGSSVIFNWN